MGGRTTDLTAFTGYGQRRRTKRGNSRHEIHERLGVEHLRRIGRIGPLGIRKSPGTSVLLMASSESSRRQVRWRHLDRWAWKMRWSGAAACRVHQEDLATALGHGDAGGNHGLYFPLAWSLEVTSMVRSGRSGEMKRRLVRIARQASAAVDLGFRYT